jgi:hypothetical protein
MQLEDLDFEDLEIRYLEISRRNADRKALHIYNGNFLTDSFTDETPLSDFLRCSG